MCGFTSFTCFAPLSLRADEAEPQLVVIHKMAAGFRCSPYPHGGLIEMIAFDPTGDGSYSFSEHHSGTMCLTIYGNGQSNTRRSGQL